MADKAKFVSDFRNSITAMVGAYNHMLGVIQTAQTLGWTVDDFGNVMSGSDVTAAELFEAIESCASLSAIYATEAPKLAKLLP